MGEGGHRIRGAEAREGAALVWVKQARLPCQRGEPDGQDGFKDLRDGFEEDDNAEGSRGVIGRLAGFVKDDPIGVFERGGVVPKGDQWSQEVEEEAGVDSVYFLPD